MRKTRSFVRPRLTVLLALLCCFLAIVGTVAFFTDRISVQTGVTLNVEVGDGNLVFIDTSSNTTDDNGNKSNNPTALDRVWNGALISDDGNLNPGDFFDLSYALTNTGAKSIDVRQQLVVTSTVPMTEGTEEYYLTILYDGIATPVPGTLSADGLTLTYDLPDMIFNGTSESETGGLGKTDFNVRLTFLREAKNAFMRSGVNVTYRVQAKGHRESTDADWSDWAQLDTQAELDKAILESITVTAPTGYAYVEEGTDFDKSSVTVKAHFEGGDEMVINDFDVIGGEAMTRDKTKVTISYTKGSVTKTAEIDVRVVTPVAIDSTNRSYAGYTGAADEVLEIKDYFYDESKGYWCKTTSIGNYAFENCTNLKGVKIPDTATAIGAATFYGCSTLESIEIPDSVTSMGSEIFRGCTGLTSVQLSANVAYVPTHTFNGCTNLKNITIPDKVTNIGSYAFANCTSLTSVDLGKRIQRIESYAFDGCTNLKSVVIQDTLTTVDMSAFLSCNSLKNVCYTGDKTQWSEISIHGYGNIELTGATRHYNYDRSVGIAVAIDSTNRSYAGYTGEANQDWVIPEQFYDESKGLLCTPTSIANNAFQNVTTLKSVTFPDTVTSIGTKAFMGCTSLTSLDLGEGVTTIGNSAFENCSNIAGTLVVPKSVTNLGQYAFWNCAKVTKVVIEATTLTSLSGAFGGCAGLTSVGPAGSGASLELPASVTSLASSEFEDCTGLTEVVLPETITSFGTYAFYCCTNLKSIQIPASLKTVNNYAFHGCSALTDIYFTGTESQWSGISVGTNNSPMTSATKHYNSTMPQ